MWEEPIIFLDQDHCRDYLKWSSLEDLIAHIREAIDFIGRQTAIGQNVFLQRKEIRQYPATSKRNRCGQPNTRTAGRDGLQRPL